MKTTRSKKTKSGPGPQKIRIEFQAAQARHVSVAGTFNDWRPDVTPMLDVGGGRWVKELVLPPGRYEYLFVVDGEWKCDPAAVQQVVNPYGTNNSLLEVQATPPPGKGPEP